MIGHWNRVHYAIFRQNHKFRGFTVQARSRGFTMTKYVIKTSANGDIHGGTVLHVDIGLRLTANYSKP